MRLHEIQDCYLTVIDGGLVYDEDTGEVIFDASDFEAVEAAYNEKIEALGLYVKDLDADAAAIREEERKLAERRRIKERKADRLREYMRGSMERTGVSKVETSRVAVSTRKSKRVDITDEKAVPFSFLKIEQKVDKNKIMKVLKAGEDVPGAELVSNVNLMIK